MPQLWSGNTPSSCVEKRVTTGTTPLARETIRASPRRSRRVSLHHLRFWLPNPWYVHRSLQSDSYSLSFDAEFRSPFRLPFVYVPSPISFYISPSHPFSYFPSFQAFLLNLWTALILGLLYILFNGFPIVFRGNHGFNLQQAGLSFLGIGVGIVAGVLSQPIWRRLYERDCARSADGKAPPESRLYSGMLGAILCPLSLFLFAGTSMGSVHWRE
jgi:hypothetical protein